MTWHEVIADPSLADLPYKIELNKHGKIVMSPASNNHGFFQIRIATLLGKNAGNGVVLAECSIDTDDGTKVADVAWMSDAFHKAHKFTTPYPLSPDLCIEIASPSNTRAELLRKRKLYFAQGAKEFWLCDENGGMSFYNPSRKISKSALFPAFPKTI